MHTEHRQQVVLCSGLTLVLQMYMPLVLSLVFTCVVLYTWRRSVPPNCVHRESRGGRERWDGGREGREGMRREYKIGSNISIYLCKFGQHGIVCCPQCSCLSF